MSDRRETATFHSVAKDFLRFARENPGEAIELSFIIVTLVIVSPFLMAYKWVRSHVR